MELKNSGISITNLPRDVTPYVTHNAASDPTPTVSSPPTAGALVPPVYPQSSVKNASTNILNVSAGRRSDQPVQASAPLVQLSPGTSVPDYAFANDAYGDLKLQGSIKDYANAHTELAVLPASFLRKNSDLIIEKIFDENGDLTLDGDAENCAKLFQRLALDKKKIEWKKQACVAFCAFPLEARREILRSSLTKLTARTAFFVTPDPHKPILCKVICDMVRNEAADPKPTRAIFQNLLDISPPWLLRELLAVLAQLNKNQFASLFLMQKELASSLVAAIATVLAHFGDDVHANALQVMLLPNNAQPQSKCVLINA